MYWNKHNKRSGKHSVKCIKSGNNECRKCPKNAKNIRKNIPCDRDSPCEHLATNDNDHCGWKSQAIKAWDPCAG